MGQTCEENQSCFVVQIVQTAAKTFFARLFYAKTGEPFDLTGVTEIVALFPGSSGTPVKKTYTSAGGVTVVGAPGAGKIQIALTTTDTALMQANPQIAQNLQVIVTIAGVAQIDSLSFGSPPVAGVTYVDTLNGISFSYMAKAGDTAEEVFSALAALISVSSLPITPSINGIDDSAALVLSSQIPGLGFTDVPSSTITKMNSVANGGLRTIFLIQQALNIQPQDYTGD